MKNVSILSILDHACAEGVSYAAFTYALGVFQFPWVSEQTFNTWKRHAKRERQHG